MGSCSGSKNVILDTQVFLEYSLWQERLYQLPLRQNFPRARYLPFTRILNEIPQQIFSLHILFTTNYVVAIVKSQLGVIHDFFQYVQITALQSRNVAIPRLVQLTQTSFQLPVLLWALAYYSTFCLNFSAIIGSNYGSVTVVACLGGIH